MQSPEFKSARFRSIPPPLQPRAASQRKQIPAAASKMKSILLADSATQCYLSGNFPIAGDSPGTPKNAALGSDSLVELAVRGPQVEAGTPAQEKVKTVM